MSWEKVKLGDLYEVHNGLSKGGKFFGSGYPFLSFSTVFNNWFIPQSIKDLVQSTDKEQESYSIKKGDVFITRTSETADELGMSCVALKDYPQATYNGFCKRLRPIKSSYEVNPRYIGYYLRTSDFRGKFLGLSGTMTTRASLRNEDLLAMEILLPPLKEQKRIADILSAYDNLIENNQKQIKLLEEAAQRLYKQWFIDLRYPGHETTPIVDGLPKGWRKDRADSFFNITIGKTPPRAEKQWFTEDGNGMPWISISDMGTDSAFLFETSEGLTLEAIKRHNVKVVPANTVLLSFKLTVGRVSITTTEMCTNEAIAHFVTDDDSLREYTYCYLKNFHYDELGSTSSISKAINSKIVKAMPFVIPYRDLLKKFHLLAKPIFEKVFTNQKQIINLIQSRDRLLTKLMTGELEV